MRKVSLATTCLFFALSVSAQWSTHDGSPGSEQTLDTTGTAHPTPDYVGRRAEHRQKFMLTLRGGWSFMTGRNHSPIEEVDSYKAALGKGHHLLAEAAYFTHKDLGVGLRMNAFRTRGGIEITEWSQLGARTGMMSDDILTAFIGPSLYGRMYTADQNTVIMASIAMGRMFYRNKGVYFDPYTEKGSAMGVSYGFSMDRMICDKLAIGASFSHSFSTLKQLEMHTDGRKMIVPLTVAERRRLSRIDLSLGIQRYF